MKYLNFAGVAKTGHNIEIAQHRDGETYALPLTAGQATLLAFHLADMADGPPPEYLVRDMKAESLPTVSATRGGNAVIRWKAGLYRHQLTVHRPNIRILADLINDAAEALEERGLDLGEDEK